MSNQIRVELYKLKTSAVFYLILGGLLAMSLLSANSILQMDLVLYGGDVFVDALSDTSLLFTLTLFVSYFVGMDFGNRTIHNEIRTGYSRLSTILSKGAVALPASVFTYLVAYAVPLSLIIGIANGFGTEITLQHMVSAFVLFSLQLMAIQSFTVLFHFVFKKPTLGMLVSVCFTFVTCNLLRNFFDESNPLFAVTSFYRIMMNFEIQSTQDFLISFSSAIITIGAVFTFAHIVFRKADMK